MNETAQTPEILRCASPDLFDKNVRKLAELFPNCVTEVKDGTNGLKLAVDFDKLRQQLDGSLRDDREAYEFTWPGKKQANNEAYAPIQKTLRPRVDDSVDWDNTKNLYIEGNNLEALKLLQESYLGKVKMIYIDPPYNTGNDFLYRDNFSMSREEYDEDMDIFDDFGNRKFKNTESIGRFHSNWCSMIYPRLLLARNLLTDDGVIFISIDDNEVENLKKICSEVFGESNFLAHIVWERAYSPVNLKKHFSENHDFILCYAKNIERITCNGLPRSIEANSRYSNPDNDPRGPWTSGDLSVGPRVESRVYEITTPSGRKVMPPSGYCWRLDQSTFEQYRQDNRIWFGENGNNVPRIKRFISDVKQGVTPMTIWKYKEVGHSQDAAQGLKKIFDGKAYFEYPKPVGLIKRCLLLYSKKDSIILDFFSGSATTAHAVMQLNAEDGGNRQFILVQIQESCGEKTEARKAKYATICEIGKERIRRAGQKIKSESGRDDLDVGFRVLEVADSNRVDLVEEEKRTGARYLYRSVLKEDRTELDLLFGCLLDWGLTLSEPFKSEEVAGHRIYDYAEGALIACFEENVSEELVKEIAKRKPARVVFKDDCFKSCSEKVNFFQIFKESSPNTTLKTL